MGVRDNSSPVDQPWLLSVLRKVSSRNREKNCINYFGDMVYNHLSYIVSMM